MDILCKIDGNGWREILKSLPVSDVMYFLSLDLPVFKQSVTKMLIYDNTIDVIYRYRDLPNLTDVEIYLSNTLLTDELLKGIPKTITKYTIFAPLSCNTYKYNEYIMSIIKDNVLDLSIKYGVLPSNISSSKLVKLKYNNVLTNTDINNLPSTLETLIVYDIRSKLPNNIKELRIKKKLSTDTAKYLPDNLEMLTTTLKHNKVTGIIDLPQSLKILHIHEYKCNISRINIHSNIEELYITCNNMTEFPLECVYTLEKLYINTDTIDYDKILNMPPIKHIQIITSQQVNFALMKIMGYTANSYAKYSVFTK